MDGDGTGVGAVSTTTTDRGVDGTAAIFHRDRTIVRVRCRMAAALDMEGIGGIVRQTIGLLCRGIVRVIAVLGRVSQAIRVIVRGVRFLGIPGIVPEVRVQELRGIDRELQGMAIVLELRGTGALSRVLETETDRGHRGMAIGLETREMEIVRGIRGLLEMEIDREVVRGAAVRHSLGRGVESRHPSLVRLRGRHNRTVRRRSRVLLRGRHNLVPRRSRGPHRVVQVRSLVPRARADRNSLGRLGGRHRAHRQTVVAASRTRLCL